MNRGKYKRNQLMLFLHFYVENKPDLVSIIHERKRAGNISQYNQLIFLFRKQQDLRTQGNNERKNIPAFQNSKGKANDQMGYNTVVFLYTTSLSSSFQRGTWLHCFYSGCDDSVLVHSHWVTRPLFVCTAGHLQADACDLLVTFF